MAEDYIKISLRKSLHEGLGGNGWAYSYDGGNELEDLDSILDEGVAAVITEMANLANNQRAREAMEVLLEELRGGAA